MKPLCILITNHSLCEPGGSELYVCDLAMRLVERSHRPVVYSTRLGKLAEKLLHATVPVIDNLDQMGMTPDIIHCHHSLATATALLRFPDTPAIYVCHDWAWHHDTPPRMRRIRRIVAVDQTVAERIMFREGRRPDEVQILHNGIDLRKFRARNDLLPPKPRKALVFSNYMREEHVALIRQACNHFGIEVDAVGKAAGCPVENPENLLTQYDLVFAKGRCAWEAIACGAAVIVCDVRGVGGMARSDNLQQFLPRNFGRRLLKRSLDTSTISAEIARYDSLDAAKVTQHVRDTANLDLVVDRLLNQYYEVILEHDNDTNCDPAAELRELSRMLAWCDRSQGLWQTNFQGTQVKPPESKRILRFPGADDLATRKRAV